MVIGELYKVIGNVAQHKNWPPTHKKSIPFYSDTSNTKFLEPGYTVLFLAEERNHHWPDQEWYWWRVYCLNTNEVGHIMIDDKVVERLDSHP